MFHKQAVCLHRQAATKKNDGVSKIKVSSVFFGSDKEGYKIIDFHFYSDNSSFLYCFFSLLQHSNLRLRPSVSKETVCTVCHLLSRRLSK